MNPGAMLTVGMLGAKFNKAIMVDGWSLKFCGNASQYFFNVVEYLFSGQASNRQNVFGVLFPYLQDMFHMNANKLRKPHWRISSRFL